MSILTRKLLRTIQATRGQFLALVVIVTLGVLIYISMNTTYFNLSHSQQQFYQDNRFADYTFQVVKAPESVAARVEAVPGVLKVTGRIQKDVPIIKEGNPGRGKEPAMGGGLAGNQGWRICGTGWKSGT